MMYDKAIAIWLENNQAKGNCYEASVFMRLAFPELRLVRGHYGSWQHWWNVTPDGVIVDATVSQFPFKAKYEAYCGPEVYGRCHECGGHVYIPGEHFCSEACEAVFMEALNASK